MVTVVEKACKQKKLHAMGPDPGNTRLTLSVPGAGQETPHWACVDRAYENVTGFALLIGMSVTLVHVADCPPTATLQTQAPAPPAPPAPVAETAERTGLLPEEKRR